MATVGQVYYNVIDNNSGSYISSGEDIFSDIVSAIGASQFTKIGVQSPIGSQMVLNDSKTIMVGRTGIYELDEDIAITSMYFVRPRQYVKDEDASDAALEQGVAAIQAAEEERAAALEAFYAANPTIPDKDTDADAYQAYWDAYNEIQSAYITAYSAGLDLYNQGINGIYTLPNPSNPEADENYKDLYNVIVDFIYE